VRTLTLSVGEQIAIKIIDENINTWLKHLCKVRPSKLPDGSITYHISDLFHVRDLELLTDIEKLIR